MEMFEISKSCITEEVMWAYDRYITDYGKFIKDVFLFLSLHNDLLENPDYDRLYQECLVYTNKVFNKDKAAMHLQFRDYRETIEMLGGIYRKYYENYSGVPLEREEVDHFLAFRKKAWDQ